MAEERATGVVKWFDTNKGYGFIGQQNGDDVFVHIADVQRSDLTTLFEGQRVDFDIKETPKGLQAENLDSVEVEPQLPPDVGPPPAEPVSLADIFYASSLHMFELERADPEQCEVWDDTSLAEVDPKFRIDMNIVGPYDDENYDEFFERKLSILEDMGDLAGLRVACDAVLASLREHERSHR
ncbi:MAG: Cold shock protein CspC [Anaerolineales bacterium]|nr:Cold shock protein CspC [Anaerolineales bacterium]